MHRQTFLHVLCAVGNNSDRIDCLLMVLSSANFFDFISTEDTASMIHQFWKTENIPDIAVLLFQRNVSGAYRNDTHAAWTRNHATKKITKHRAVQCCAYTSPAQREEQKPLISQFVCVYFLHQSATEGSAEWLPDRVCKFQAWLLSICETVRFFLSSSSSSSLCCCPWCPERLSGGALKHNIPNEMWLVSPCCSISTWWDGRSGERRCKKKKKTAGPPLDELHWLSKSTEGAVQFSPSHWRKEEHTFPRRQRTIVDNYLVKSPGRWHLQHTASGRHTTDIWLSKCNGAIVLMLATEATASSGGKEQFKK